MGSRLAVVAIRVGLIMMLAGICVVGTAARASAATIHYVKAGASGANNGTSWANAYKSLQPALAAAANGDQIWVAKGTYKPTARTIPTDARSATFTLPNGVAIYGGFAGGETLLSQRKPGVNVTILSGDIGTAGDPTDNVYHVVYVAPVGFVPGLDGFTITGGTANGTGMAQGLGAGVYCPTSSVFLTNMIIQGNQASVGGGGLYMNNCGANLHKVTISGNKVTGFGNGGGMFAQGTGPLLTKVTFSGNSATYGGGMYSYGSDPMLTNVTFSSNSTTGSSSAGGGMFNDAGSSPTLNRVTFMNDTSVNEGAGMMNVSSSATITHAAFINNTAGTDGGGLYDNGSSVTLTDATIYLNTATEGGGIFNDSSSPQLVNVTLANNQALVEGGGMYNFNHSEPALSYVTFSKNSTQLPGSGAAIINNVFSSATIHDSILWGDVSDEILNKENTSSASISYTIIQGGCPTPGGTCSNLSMSDPKLGLLQNNGGFAQTMAPGAGSAAIDGALNSNCALGVPTDGRGVARPQGLTCDLGAYEVKVATFTSQAVNDGWVRESGKATNVGGGANSGSANIQVGDDNLDRRERGFLSFDTSSLADSASVVRANVQVMQAGSAGNATTQGKLMIDLARPYFGSGVGLATSDYQASATVSPAGSFGMAVFATGSWYTAGLNTAARSDINKTGTTQFRLRFSTDTYNEAYDFVSFYSGNAGTTADWPVLTVYYNP